MNYILNMSEFGIDVACSIAREIPIAGIIGLDTAAGDHVSGYADQRQICADLGFDYLPVTDYRLRDAVDRAAIEALDIDFLFVLLGWQRLVPQWLIQHVKSGVIGCHGSADGITKGRGRSPMNWALITGRSSFSISIFVIDEDVDSGHVIDTRHFPITAIDNIHTLYHKSSLAVSEMVVAAYHSGALSGDDKASGQKEGAEYLPQRMPEDGSIDWSLRAAQIDGFVRALGKPYPGARSRIGDMPVTIWRGMPFDMDLNRENQPGEIVKVFQCGSVLVACRDGFYLATELQTPPECRIDHTWDGRVFVSVPSKDAMRNIVSRHESKHPDQPLNANLLEFIDRLS